MTTPAITDFVAKPWVNAPSTETPIDADRLSRFENQLQTLTQGMAAVLRAGSTGSQLLQAGTPEQARGVLGAAAAGDVTSRVINQGGITGIRYWPTTPTAADLLAANIPSGTLVIFPLGVAYLLGQSLIPIGPASGGSLNASTAFTAIGVLAVTTRLNMGAARAATVSAVGFLAVTATLSGPVGGSVAVLTAAGTLTVTATVAAYTGRYNDTYGNTYGQ